MRVYAISDLHVDYPENLEWTLSLDKTKFVNDVLILAGDVTDDLELLTRVLQNLRECFSRLLFVPGNHELWIRRGDEGCSLEKFDNILRRCDELDVVTQPICMEGVSFVPLFAWYDYSFGEPDRQLRRAWRDFKACKWPQYLSGDEAVNRHFLEINEPHLSLSNDTVISFSHFVPRIDVMPDAIPEKRRQIYPVLGSGALGEQIARLGSDIHVYGHSHVNQDIFLGKTRFINNAFAYPDETRISSKQLHCVFDSTKAVNKETVSGQL